MDENELNPKGREMALHSLTCNPGWPIYCARFTEIVRREIEEKIFDVETTPEQTEILKKARKVLAEHTPEKMLKSMMNQARTELDRIERGKPAT